MAGALALIACGNPPKPSTTPAPVRATTPAAPSVGAGSAVPPAPQLTTKDIGCPSPSCVYHAGANAYFTCTASGSGGCVHFGPACAPPDGCMYDPGDRTYKSCTKIVEGSCRAWGAACTPNACMIDPRDGYYRQCTQQRGGTCSAFAALCTP